MALICPWCPSVTRSGCWPCHGNASVHNRKRCQAFGVILLMLPMRRHPFGFRCGWPMHTLLSGSSLATGRPREWVAIDDVPAAMQACGFASSICGAVAGAMPTDPLASWSVASVWLLRLHTSMCAAMVRSKNRRGAPHGAYARHLSVASPTSSPDRADGSRTVAATPCVSSADP